MYQQIKGFFYCNPIEEQSPPHLLAYDLTQYDNVIVIIHPSSMQESHAALVKHDKSKDRYYIVGKLVRLRMDRMNYDAYPVSNAIALVPSDDVIAYNKTTKTEKKRDFIVNIFFGEILFITVDFDSLDWKKITNGLPTNPICNVIQFSIPSLQALFFL